MNALSQKVSMAEKIGYSLGDCSANLVFQMMMIYPMGTLDRIAVHGVLCAGILQSRHRG